MKRILLIFTGLIAILALVALFSSGLPKAIPNIAKGYANTQLYNDAISLANQDSLVNIRFGDLEHLEMLAILEGETQFSNDNTQIKSSVKLSGDKRKGRLDIEAVFENGKWNYTYIAARIKIPEEEKEIIVILSKL